MKEAGRVFMKRWWKRSERNHELRQMEADGGTAHRHGATRQVDDMISRGAVVIAYQ